MTKDEEQAIALRVAKECYNHPSPVHIEFASRFLEEIRKTQEPVAWMDAQDGSLWSEPCGRDDIPLYTTPTISPHLCLVPREPTEEMLSAPKKACCRSVAEYVYKAMLIAGEGKS